MPRISLEPVSWKFPSEKDLARCKGGFDSGDQSAVWEAYLMCEKSGTPKPQWLLDELERFAKSHLHSSKQVGRPPNVLSDIGIVGWVGMIRRKKGRFGRVSREGEVNEPGPKAKPRRYSYQRAFRLIQESLREIGTEIPVRSIEKAYERGKKLLKQQRAGKYLGSSFFEGDVSEAIYQVIRSTPKNLS